MQILCAPLQGYTTAIYRQLHHQLIGGIHTYYTPFIRWEHGEIRNKDRRDIDPANNLNTPVVPQVIVRDREEFCHLADEIQHLGWSAIDLNLGCPFPLQTHAHRGSGLLPYPDAIAQIFDEMRLRPEVTFSVKMRLGFNSPSESEQLIPLLNQAPLALVTLHPRLGIQQYRGIPDLDAFETFYCQCTLPLAYNGDLTTLDQMRQIRHRFPNLRALMVGRGLMANPLLALEYLHDAAYDEASRLDALMRLHEPFFHEACSRLQGDTQIINHMLCFWQYAGQSGLLAHKAYKAIKKSKTLPQYREAVRTLLSLHS